MITVKVGEHELGLYSNSKDMPHYLYTTFLRMLMIEAGVGSTIESVMDHCKSLYQYAANGMMEETKKEAENLHYNFNLVLNGVNFQSMAFACRVVHLDGEKFDDYSDDGLKAIADKLGLLGVTQQQMEDFVEELKKKITAEMRVAFPEFFPDDESIVFFQKLKQKIMLSVSLFDEDPNEFDKIKPQLEAINQYFLELRKPKNFKFDDPENEIVVFEKNCMGLYAMLDGNGIHSAKMLPVFDFYARLDYLKKSNQPSKNIR